MRSSEQNRERNASPRRLKKREIDRRSQRLARERNKSRIAQLEAIVEDLQQSDSSGQIAILNKRVEEMARLNAALISTLRQIGTSVGKHQDLWKAASSDTSVQESNNALASEICTSEKITDDAPVVVESDISNGFGETGAEKMLAPEIHPSINGSQKTSYTQQTFGKIDTTLHINVTVESNTMCDCLCPTQRRHNGTPPNMYRFANEVLCGQTDIHEETDVNMEEIDADIPIRAIVEGWDTVQHNLGGKLPSAWQKLRKIDEVVFASCGKTERLAILQMMHLVLKNYDSSLWDCGLVPKFYQKRPSQELQHDHVIDFLVWPGLRERAIFMQHRYCSNLFWRYFSTNFRILWPYAFRDCYTQTNMTGKYCISTAFATRINDINAWTMTSDIFQRWPEISSDIPSFESIPRSLSPPSLHLLAEKESALCEVVAGDTKEDDRSFDKQLLAFPDFDPWNIALTSS